MSKRCFLGVISGKGYKVMYVAAKGCHCFLGSILFENYNNSSVKDDLYVRSNGTHVLSKF